MDLLYSSTRNGEEKVTASKAILKGLADDGGLFVPESIPKLDVTIEELAKMSYQGDSICGHEAVFYRLYRRRVKELH